MNSWYGIWYDLLSQGRASRKLFNLLASGPLTQGNFQSFRSEAESYLRSYSQGDNCFLAIENATAFLNTSFFYSLLLQTYFST